MIDKLIYKRIYEWIKYENYINLLYFSNEEDVWLFHEKTKTLKRIIFTKETLQSIHFIVDKMNLQKAEIEHLIKNKIQHIELILVDEDNITSQNIDGVKIDVINHQKNINQVMHHKFIGLTKYVKPQSKSYYKRRIFNNQLIDNAITKFSPITAVLLVLNIMIYFVLLFKPSSNQSEFLLENGALTHFNFVHGDYFRIITSMFVHLDFSHLLLNMMSLFIFGKIIEYLFGKWKYLLIYLLGGMIGNLLSLTFDTTSISAGASGGICALMGAFIVYLITTRLYKPKFIIQITAMFILFMLLTNLFNNVNNYAHFGGFVGGILIALTLYLFKVNRKYFWFTLVVFLITILMMLLNIFTQKENHIYNQMVMSEFESGDVPHAKNILKKIIKHGYENDETYTIYGLIAAHDDNIDSAIEIWKKGVHRYPNSPDLNYQLALAYRSIDKYDTAQKYIDKAVALKNNKQYDALQHEIKTFR